MLLLHLRNLKGEYGFFSQQLLSLKTFPWRRRMLQFWKPLRKIFQRRTKVFHSMSKMVKTYDSTKFISAKSSYWHLEKNLTTLPERVCQKAEILSPFSENSFITVIFLQNFSSDHSRGHVKSFFGKPAEKS